VRQVRERSIVERLGRGESLAYAEAAVRVWDEDTLTLGFARRIATYKRLYLLTANPERALRLLDGPQHLQIAIAGRAHPQDDGAKQTVQRLFALNDTPVVGEHAVFLEQHDMELAAQLVQGCDLWLNLPRPPQEASGTSGMKSAINGGLQLSVLDGWWAEAHDGRNGWAIQSDASLSPEDQDARDAAAFFDVLELDAVPLFYARGDDGVPTEWVRRMRHSLRSLTPRFSAIRMVREYAARYPGGHPHRPR
jgi:starch phosphorylase